MKSCRLLLQTTTVFCFATFLTHSPKANAAPTSCKDLPTHEALQKALTHVAETGNGGIFKPNMMWAAVVNRAGEICAIAKTGDAWPGSRVIAAQKASAANAFSNEKLSLSTANLFTAVQPGGSLFGLQHSNPLDTAVIYQGRAETFGKKNDPMVAHRPGGVNVFGGGLALYGKDGKTVLGGLGVSGDTSCADHNIAWGIRQALKLDHIPGGVSPSKDDNIIYDLDAGGKSASGFGHPACSPEATEQAKGLKISATK